MLNGCHAKNEHNALIIMLDLSVIVHSNTVSYTTEKHALIFILIIRMVESYRRSEVLYD